MKNAIAISLVLLLVLSCVVTISSTGQDRRGTTDMLLLIKRDQKIRISKSTSGGYSVKVLTEEEIANPPENSRYTVYTTTVVTPNYLVVSDGERERVYAAHAIEVIDRPAR